MPLDGHWQRVNTPVRALTGRERRIVAAALAVVLAATIALVVAAVSSSTPPPGRGCIAAFVGGATGGVLVSGCGAQARRICAERRHQSDPGSQGIEASCRRAGIG
jgi:hypothetical protein